MTTDQMISTGRAALLMGVSRQHVVDLCEAQQLTYVRVGTHRRIPLSSIAPYTRDITEEQRRSLWLHHRVAGQLSIDPEAVMAAARENITRWLPGHRRDGRTSQHLWQWLRILDAGVDATLVALTDRSDLGCDLRSSSPFAGVLSDEDRTSILAAARRHPAP